MVFLKRTLDNRFNDHNLPPVPRAPRSTRRRGLSQKSPEGGSLCAFELLATVAGKLLEESECSSASSSAGVEFDQCGIDKDAIKKEPQDVDKPLGAEHDEQGSSEGSVFFSGLQRDICKGKLETMGEAIGEHASPFASSACSVKVDSDSKSSMHKSRSEFVKLAGKREGSVPKCEESDDTNVEKGNDKNSEISGETSGDCTMTNKSPASTNFEEKVGLPLCRDTNPNASIPKLGNYVKIGCKDDDEIVSHDSQPDRKVKVYNSKTHIGDQKMRKLLTSNLWNTAPKLKDYELSNTDGAVKHINHSKRYPYDMDRSQHNTPFKKRRLFDRSSVITYDGGISCESVCNSPEKSLEDEKNASAWKLHEGKRISSSAFGRQSSCNTKNSNVRLSIKSFKVPELFIEVPKSTTVCSLKQTVIEAVTTILGGELRVGVLLHGKNICDDEKTLLQSGISQNDNMDSVVFMLESDRPTQPSQLICSEDPSLPCDSPKFVNRSLANPDEDMFLHDTPDKDKPSMTVSDCPAGSSADLVPSPSTELAEKIDSDAKALVPVPEASMEALAVVPGKPRPNRCEIGRRRARRPFSVSEVEALVQAVEKLGTGRWRDVKLCAFENAKHRTYVDLKDKWKTLVHTARISPQQRRGEQVPQELLDRVLAAQAYWSDHQAKQHGKQHQAIVPKLTNCATVKA